MGNGQVVDINFKLYGNPKNLNNLLVGDREKVQDANKGFVYIYRTILNAEKKPGDSKIIRFDGKVDLSNGQSMRLNKTDFGEKNNYFFFYSQINLDDAEDRIELLRQDLERKISLSSKEIQYNRVCYIPISSDTINSTYMMNASYLDAFFSNQEQTTIYLHDWLGYFEECARYYNSKIEEYKKFIDADDVPLSNYCGNHRYDKSKIRTDCFKRSELLNMAISVKDLVESNSDKYSNNVRHELISRRYQRIYKHDYQNLIEEVDNFLRNIRGKVKSCTNWIIAILSDRYNRLDSTLIDYIFGGADDQERLLKITGISLEQIYNFADDDKLEIFKNTIIKNMAGIDEMLLGTNGIDKSAELGEIYKLIGERSILSYILNFDVFSKIPDEMVNIFDCILEICKDHKVEVNKPIIKTLETIRLSGMKGKKVKVDMGLSEIKRFYTIEKKAGRANNFNGTEVEYWMQNRQQYADEIFQGRKTDWIEYQKDGKTRYRLEVECIEKQYIDSQFTTKVKLLKKVSEGVGNIIDMINMFNDIKDIVDFSSGYRNKSLWVIVPSFLSNGIALFEKPIGKGIKLLFKQVEGKMAYKFAGGGAILMQLVVEIIETAQKSAVDDYDSAAYNMLAVTSLLVGGIGFVMSLTGVVVAAVLFAAFFKILSDYYSDGPVDLYLKYCIWGWNYRYDLTKASFDLDSWWPLEDNYEHNNIKKIYISKNKEDAETRMLLYAKEERNSRQFAEKTLDRNIFFYKLVMQVLPYQLKAETFRALELVHYYRHLYIELQTVINLFELNSITIQIFKKSQARIGRRASESKIYETTIEADDDWLIPGNNLHHLFKKDNRAITITDDEEEANGVRFFIYADTDEWNEKVEEMKRDVPSHLRQDFDAITRMRVPELDTYADKCVAVILKFKDENRMPVCITGYTTVVFKVEGI